jgi:hypothetical protein
MRRRIGVFVAALSFFAALPSAGAPYVGTCEANDAGSTPASASTLDTPVVCSGTLTVGDTDLYAFHVLTPGRVELRFTPAPGTTASTVLLDPGNGDQSASCDANGVCLVLQARKGRWVAGLSHTGGAGGSYALELAVAPGQPNELCEDGGDAPGSSPAAQPVTPPLVCTGAIGQPGDTDWYTFTMPAGAGLQTVLSRTTGGPIYLYVMGPVGVRSCTQSTVSFCFVQNAEAGTWYIGVRGLGPNDSGGYALALNVTESKDPTPTTCEPQDAGDTSANATTLTSPAVCTARIANAADRDVFAFDLMGSAEATHQIVLAVSALNGSQFDVTLTDRDGAVVPCTTQRAVVCSVRRTDAAGRWHVSVSRGVPGAYALTLLAMDTSTDALGTLVSDTVNGALAPTLCESPDDAPNDAPGATPLPWAAPTETVALCRGTVAPTDPADRYAFDVQTDATTVRVATQPGATTLDLILAVTPPPETCAPSVRVNGVCPAITSQMGRGGQMDMVEVRVAYGAKSGPWLIRVTRDAGEGDYALSVVVQGS